MIEKLLRLMRYHRQNVFNESNGDAHHRALLRLKRTATFKEMTRQTGAHARYLMGERMARMGY